MGREGELINQLTRKIKGLEGRVCYGGSASVPKKYLRLFFEDQASNKISVIQFPADEDKLKNLIDACAPATFGRGTENVFDMEYRNAVYLDDQHFAIHFHPAATNLLNEISKWMVSHDHNLRAELYKLNVYAVGGHFKTHVDTPRGNDMVGSLVVCLPSAFEGGQLIIRHKGKKREFDWGTTSNQEGKVQWAAFYSDCEHEISPVTRGYRVTLTYNLYSERIKSVAGVTVDPTSLPFYDSFKEALDDPEFLPHGGILGFCLQHAYPLTEGDFENAFGDALKGGDSVLYEVAQKLGVEVEIKAVYEVELGYEERRRGANYGNSYYNHKVLMVGRRFVGGGSWCKDERSKYRIVKEDCNARICPDIIWCNRPTEWERASTYVAYGNDPTSASIYVAGAFLVSIKPWGDRGRETS